MAIAALGALGLMSCSDGTADEVGAADVAAGAASVPTPGSPALIGVTEARALLADPPPGLLVLDVRTPEEFAEGALANARLIDFQSPDFAAEVSTIDRDTPVLVTCRSGNRSAQAIAVMVELGFTDLTDLDGGLVAWRAAGLPLVAG